MLSRMTRSPSVVQWPSPASPLSEKSMLAVLVVSLCRVSGGMLVLVSRNDLWLWQDKETHDGYAQLEGECSLSKPWRIIIVELSPKEL